MEAIKVIVEILKKYSKKKWQRAILILIAGGVMALVTTSCKGLWVKGDGTHNYEYEYRKEVKTNNKDYGYKERDTIL